MITSAFVLISAISRILLVLITCYVFTIFILRQIWGSNLRRISKWTSEILNVGSSSIRCCYLRLILWIIDSLLASCLTFQRIIGSCLTTFNLILILSILILLRLPWPLWLITSRSIFLRTSLPTRCSLTRLLSRCHCNSRISLDRLLNGSLHLATLSSWQIIPLGLLFHSPRRLGWMPLGHAIGCLKSPWVHFATSQRIRKRAYGLGLGSWVILVGCLH